MDFIMGILLLITFIEVVVLLFFVLIMVVNTLISDFRENCNDKKKT
jgi:hypothetical protein